VTVDAVPSPVLVVGGAGFVGSNLVRALVARGAEVTVVDNLLSANRTDILNHSAVAFIEGSITDPSVLARLTDRYDWVYHLATFHGNQSSIADPLADHDNNLLPTLCLLEHVKRWSRLRRFVFSSAGCTVAEKTSDEPRPTTEADPVSLHLDSPYQISKIVGELYGNYFHSRFGVPVVIARFQNVYGPWEILGAGRWRGTPETVWRNVVPTFVYRALTGQPLRLDDAGRPSRDFIYVDDVVRGLIRCAEAGEPGEVYNLASGVETTIRELADLVAAAAGQPVEVVLAPMRPWDRSGRRFGSTEKSASQLGFTAETSIAIGIERTVEWTRAHLDDIDRSIARHRDRLTATDANAGHDKAPPSSHATGGRPT
jgi:nucleoside-diphosphate-sugar epimerase